MFERNLRSIALLLGGQLDILFVQQFWKTIDGVKYAFYFDIDYSTGKILNILLSYFHI